MALFFIYSKKYPNTPISFMFMLKVKAQYFPWVIMLMNFAQGGNIISDLLGIGIGLSWVFFKDVYSAKTGIDYLVTPLWFMRVYDYLSHRIENFNLYGTQNVGGNRAWGQPRAQEEPQNAYGGNNGPWNRNQGNQQNQQNQGNQQDQNQAQGGQGGHRAFQGRGVV